MPAGCSSYPLLENIQAVRPCGSKTSFLELPVNSKANCSFLESKSTTARLFHWLSERMGLVLRGRKEGVLCSS